MLTESQRGKAVDVGEWASRAMLDIIGVAGLGKDFCAISDPDSELNTMYRTVFMPNDASRFLDLAAIFVPFAIIRRLPVKRNYELDQAISGIRNVVCDLVRRKRRQLAQGLEPDADILAVSINSGGFEDEELVNQMMTLLAAGHETTATLMTWAVYHLCRHPEHQGRLHEEIRAHLPSPTNPRSSISAEEIDRLPFLNAVCNEVIRLSPAVPVTLRVATQDMSILEQFIPKGTTIDIAPSGMNLSEKEWGEDASFFKPERWLNPGCANSGGARSNYALLTFLHGPRSCLGQGFAKAEFGCLLAALVGRFQMELLDPNFTPKTKIGITARPIEPLLVRVRALEGW